MLWGWGAPHKYGGPGGIPNPTTLCFAQVPLPPSLCAPQVPTQSKDPQFCSLCSGDNPCAPTLWGDLSARPTGDTRGTLGGEGVGCNVYALGDMGRPFCTIHGPSRSRQWLVEHPASHALHRQPPACHGSPHAFPHSSTHSPFWEASAAESRRTSFPTAYLTTEIVASRVYTLWWGGSLFLMH